MSLIERHTAGGLVVAEHSMESKAIERALKQIDDRLLLWPPDATNGYWRVYSRVSDWQEPIPVTAWMDDYGTALPLSSGLIDKVNRLRLDAPNRGLSVDEHNAKREEAVEREREARSQAVKDEHRPYMERNRTSISVGNRTKLRPWQRRSLPSKEN